MTARKHSWPVRLSATAEIDFQDILRWTSERFGEGQARIYSEIIAEALAALNNGPSAIGVKVRDEIAPGLFSLHVARNRRKGRHFVIFRVAQHENRDVIDVLRILHDSMDLIRHLPSTSENNDSSQDP